MKTVLFACIHNAGRSQMAAAWFKRSSILVTMGCGEACPVVPGLRRMDWPLEDPKGKPVERVREIRDEVRSRVTELLREQGWAKV